VVQFYSAPLVQFVSALDTGCYYLGGFQPDESLEPDGDWEWVTGELFSFLNWAADEPNNAGPTGSEDVLHLGPDGRWNDIDRSTILQGYVVQYPPEDDDSDGAPNASDNCRNAPNADQTDTDGDGLGDAYDPDADGNGTPDTLDNLIAKADALQGNLNSHDASLATHDANLVTRTHE